MVWHLVVIVVGGCRFGFMPPTDAGAAGADASSDAPSTDAPTTVIAELAADTVADELPDNWAHDQLLPVMAFTGDSRWELTCQDGGAPPGSWTVDMTKVAADDCISRIPVGSQQSYPVTQVAGSSSLTSPNVICGTRQVSLRAQGVELFTFNPPNNGSLEGQWCNNVIVSGTNPPSSHRLTVTQR